MTTEARIDVGGDSSSASRAWQTLAAEVEKLNQKVVHTGNTLTKADAVAKKFTADGARMTQQYATAQERMNQRLGEVHTLFARGDISAKTYQRALAGVRNEYAGAGQAGDRMFSMAGLGFGAMVTGAGVALGALRLITAEYNNIIDRQKAAADAQLSLAGAREALLKNFTADASLNLGGLDNSLKSMAKDTGVPLKNLMLGASDSFSSKGSLTNKEAMESLREAANVSGASPEDAPKLAGAINDIRNANPGVSAKQALGMVIAGQKNARVTNLRDFATNVVPSITALSKFGDNAEESTELASMMTLGMNDLTGASSGTAAVALAAQLQKELPGLGTTKQRIAFLQSPEGARTQRKLIGTAAKPGGTLIGEAKALPVMRDLLRGRDTVSGKLLQDVSRGVPSIADSGKFTDDLLSTLESDPLLALDKFDRGLKSGAEAIKLLDREGAITEISRRGTEEVNEASGSSGIERSIDAFGMTVKTMLGADPVEEAVMRMERRGRDLEASATPFFGGPVDDKTKAVVDALKDTADRTERAIDRLRDRPVEVKVEAPKDRAKVPGVAGLDRRAR